MMAVTQRSTKRPQRLVWSVATLASCLAAATRAVCTRHRSPSPLCSPGPLLFGHRGLRFLQSTLLSFLRSSSRFRFRFRSPTVRTIAANTGKRRVSARPLGTAGRSRRRMETVARFVLRTGRRRSAIMPMNAGCCAATLPRFVKARYLAASTGDVRMVAVRFLACSASPRPLRFSSISAIR